MLGSSGLALSNNKTLPKPRLMTTSSSNSSIHTYYDNHVYNLLLQHLQTRGHSKSRRTNREQNTCARWLCARGTHKDHRYIGNIYKYCKQCRAAVAGLLASSMQYVRNVPFLGRPTSTLPRKFIVGHGTESFLTPPCRGKKLPFTVMWCHNLYTHGHSLDRVQAARNGNGW